MKKRYFLQTSAALVGTALLPPYIFHRSSIMATSNTKFEIAKSEQEWQTILTPEQFRVLRKHGTERAFTSPLDKEYSQGTYVCAACDQPLFTSDTKI